MKSAAILLLHSVILNAPFVVVYLSVAVYIVLEFRAMYISTVIADTYIQTRRSMEFSSGPESFPEK